MRPVLVKTLAVMLVTGLVLAIIGSGVLVVVLRGGIVPYFDQRIALDAQHVLVLHNGPEPTCAFIPNPPQHDCFWPDREHHAFSVYYLTPHGVRRLVWFRLL
jgi:hypothetical protein